MQPGPGYSPHAANHIPSNGQYYGGYVNPGAQYTMPYVSVWGQVLDLRVMCCVCAYFVRPMGLCCC